MTSKYKLYIHIVIINDIIHVCYTYIKQMIKNHIVSQRFVSRYRVGTQSVMWEYDKCVAFFPVFNFLVLCILDYKAYFLKRRQLFSFLFQHIILSKLTERDKPCKLTKENDRRIYY